MFEDPLYDENYPFYLDPDPDPKVKEEDDDEEGQDLDNAMKQIFSCLVFLVIGLVLLVVGYGVIQLIRTF